MEILSSGIHISHSHTAYRSIVYEHNSTKAFTTESKALTAPWHSWVEGHLRALIITSVNPKSTRFFPLHI